MRRLIPYLALVLGLSLKLSAATVIYSTSFENPPFVPGQAAGQDGWIDFGNPTHVSIENTFAHTGSQAVQISASGASGQTGIGRIDPFDSSNGDSLILLTVDMYRQSGGTPSGVEDLAGFDGSSTDIGVIRWASDNSLMIVDGNGTITVKNALTLNTWNTFGLAFDFSTRTFNAYLNGTLEASGLPFSGGNSPEFLAGSLTIQGPGTDNVFFDNYSASATPEPMYLPVCALGLVALALYRRHRSATRP